VVDRRYLLVDAEQAVDSVHRSLDGVLDGEHDVSERKSHGNPRTKIIVSDGALMLADCV
jgi:hypothetical protein